MGGVTNSKPKTIDDYVTIHELLEDIGPPNKIKRDDNKIKNLYVWDEIIVTALRSTGEILNITENTDSTEVVIS